MGLFREVLLVTGSASARSRLEDIAMARRLPNILDYFNSTAPAKRIHRDERLESQCALCKPSLPLVVLKWYIKLKYS